ncbi:NnrU family protein [Polymorphum gilvum]|uniref:Putative transmembrane protein n=1 Tax=Polymorphum gilvum (strain LMG 25793 / CGMCC 1.9160 / SL003B-26A1) TaxID=991905 RepID=F2J1P3_POLGS|nr:NnrU family protein [Polymorphum gilvum]ADZ70844.1 Putative transmembrane protein [Polymorphum gilvum SL003B-26A1]
MIQLLAGLVVFLGVHSIPMLPAFRRALMARFGDGPYRLVFSVVALVGLVLIIHGYGAARMAGPPQLYDPPLWTRHLALLLMVPVFILLIAAYLPGRLKRMLRHPMLLAIKIWAFSHLLSNGDLASVLLFGSFLAWAVADRISVKRRGLNGQGPLSERAGRNETIAIIGGLALYAAFVVKLHEVLIGVPPI